jgi:quercetin dioxygenase-like cupin family protein
MTDQSAYPDSFIFPRGNPADKLHFVGEAWAEIIVPAEETFKCPAWNVTFSPGARNNWHMHPDGQILLVTAGRGYFQAEGQPARELTAGEVVMIPPHVKHWHGAASDSWFIHLAICPNPIHGSTIWLEPVDTQEYSKLK